MKFASEKLMTLIDEILKAEGLTRENLIIGGFSQGGAMAYYIGLEMCKKISGILIMSAFLPADKSGKLILKYFMIFSNF